MVVVVVVLELVFPFFSTEASLDENETGVWLDREGEMAVMV